MSSILAFLTGGSRGFGRALAAALASGTFERGIRLTLVLLSRDVEGMSATAAAVQLLHKDAAILLHPVDLSDIAAIPRAWHGILERVQSLPRHTSAVLFNNAGSLGALKYLRDLTDADRVRESIDLNITSVVALTSLFLKAVHSSVSLEPRVAREPSAAVSTDTAALPHYVVNISSLCAIKPFSTQALYCAGKAARDMVTATVAVEESADGSCPIKSLNFAPGPLDTDMQRELRESESLHPESRLVFAKMKAGGALIDPADSAAKCVRLLLGNAFLSGAHVDYYDLP